MLFKSQILIYFLVEVARQEVVAVAELTPPSSAILLPFVEMASHFTRPFQGHFLGGIDISQRVITLTISLTTVLANRAKLRGSALRSGAPGHKSAADDLL